MDILEALNVPIKEIYTEDLDFFLRQLDLGNYSEDYKKVCRERIKIIRTRINAIEQSNALPTQDKPIDKPNVSVELAYVPIPGNEKSISKEEQLLGQIQNIRKSENSKLEFKDLIKSRTDIDEALMDKIFPSLEPWEIATVVSLIPFSEDFLEKYFSAIDHDKIARFQEFSENFFMKHYIDLNPDVVLRFGKNKWRKKEVRSKQLSLFLRLKGVKI